MKSSEKRIFSPFVLIVVLVLIYSNKSESATVVVDTSIKYQIFEGWGTSLCWWAHQEGGGSQAYLNKIADVLMDPDSGLGYNIFRYNIGGGDQAGHTEIEASRAVPGYKTNEDSDYNWNADLNQRNIVAALAAKGKKIQQEVIWETFSNSPPWWMTVSGCADGNPTGADNLKSTYFDKFADYLTEVVKHFKDNWGITFRTVDPFNEPSAGWWKGSNNQEGCNFKNEQPKMVKSLGKSLVAKGLFPTTQVSVADENSISAAISGIKTYDDSALSYISQLNTHGYSGRSTANFTSMASIAASKKKTLWMSESGPLSGTGGQDISMFMAQNIIEDLKIMKVSAWIDWQSYAGGGDWETINVDKSTLAVVPSKRCYMQAAFGRFIRPGSQIIESNDSNTIAALVPQTGNMVVIVRNGGTASVNYTFDLSKVGRLPGSVHVYQFLVSSYKVLSKLPDVSIANKQFAITVPAQSVTSCAIPGVIDPVATAPQIDLQNNLSHDDVISIQNKRTLNFYLPSADEFDLVLFSGSGRMIKSIHGQGIKGINKIDIGRYCLVNGLYLVQTQQRGVKKRGVVIVIN
jgi:O-glycosyl hydrolase